MKTMLLHAWSNRACRKWLVICSSALVFYTLAGFFGVPWLLKSQLIKRLPEWTHRQAGVRQVRCNPFALSLTIRGLELTETNGQRFAGWEEFYVNFQLSSLFRLAWTFDTIQLRQPFAEVVRNQDKSFNFDNLIAKSEPAASKPPGRIPPVRVFSIQITNGQFAVTDLTRREPFRANYQPISLILQYFTTRPKEDNPHAFEATGPGGKRLRWEGGIQVDPLTCQGQLEVTGVDLKRYMPYVADFTRAEITDGILDFSLRVNLAVLTNGVDLMLTHAAARLREFVLRDPSANETVLTVPSFAVQDTELNLRNRSVRVGAVICASPTALARLNQNGSLNWSALLPPVQASPDQASQPKAPPRTDSAGEAGSAWTFTLDALDLIQAALRFEDLVRPGSFKTELKPVDVELKQFSTRRDQAGTFAVKITTEAGESMALTGSASINPPGVRGEFQAVALNIPKYTPYVAGVLLGKILEGKLAIQSQYRASVDEGNLSAGITNSAVQLTQFRLQDPTATQEVFSVPALAVEQIEGDLATRNARVGRVTVQGGSVLARRLKDGSLNLLGLVRTPSGNAAQPADPAPSEANTSPWQARIDEVAVRDFDVKAEDLTLARPATLEWGIASLDLRGLSTLSNAPVSMTLTSRVNQSAALNAQAQLTFLPVAADLEMRLEGLELRPFQPYVDPIVKLSLSHGALNTQGRVRLASQHPPASRLAFEGDVALTNLLATDQDSFQEFLRWDALDIHGIKLGLDSNQLDIAEIVFRGLTTSLVMGPDQKLNVQKILAQGQGTSAEAPPPVQAVPEPARPKAAGSPAGASAFPIRLARLAFEKGSIQFADLSLQPHCRFHVKEFGGAIQGLSSALDSSAEIDIHGHVDEQSPFRVFGKLNPFVQPISVSLIFSNLNTQLTPFTPYLEKFGGHPLTKGRLSTALRYEIQDMKLNAQHDIFIDQLTLGPRNNSPDATSLPVKLGIALLKDRNGRISLDVPVEGRLDDPRFRVGAVVLQVLVNLLIKAATSPFSLLGAVVGGGGEELSFVDFDPGSAALPEPEGAKLAKLAKALNERPALSLEITGSMDPAADRPALALARLRDQMRTRRLQELAATNQAPPSPEGFQLDPADYARLVRAEYNLLFPPATNASPDTVPIEPAPATNTLTKTGRAMSPTRKGTDPIHGAPLLLELGRRAKPSPATGEATPVKDDSKRPTDTARRPGQPVAQGKTATAAEPAAESPSTPGEGTVPSAPPAIPLAEMEVKLASRIQIPDEELRDLMESRAKAVQAFLLKDGQVAADRLLLVAPKAIDASFQGQRQVTMSLN